MAASASFLSCGSGLGDGARLVLQIGLKGDGGVIESGVLESFFGGEGGGGDEDEQRGGEACAEPCDHRLPPSPLSAQAGDAIHGNPAL